MYALLANLPLVLAQRTTTTRLRLGSGEATAAAGVSIASLLCMLVFFVAIWAFFGYCYSKLFAKAGITPWWGYVPFLNIYGIIKLTGREPIWLLGFFVPCVNYVVIFVIMIDLAKSFGKEAGYGIGLALLSPIFLPMLAFSDAQYVGPVAAGGGGGGFGGPGGGSPYGQQPYGAPPAPGGYGTPPAPGYGTPPAPGGYPPPAPGGYPPPQPPSGGYPPPGGQQ